MEFGFYLFASFLGNNFLLSIHTKITDLQPTHHLKTFHRSFHITVLVFLNQFHCIIYGKQPHPMNLVNTNSHLNCVMITLYYTLIHMEEAYILNLSTK